MKIEIDQSGKIENTNRLTVIAFSNNINKSILISARDKKAIQFVYRKIGKARLFVYRAFAVLIFVLIEKHLKKIDQVIIDHEYPGYENLIKSFIVDVAAQNNKKIQRDIIHFRSVGKKSKVHQNAIKSYRSKRADIRLSAKEFYNLEFK